MRHFPPSQHKVVTKLGVFHSSPSQNGSFYTSAQVGATIALLVGTRHWPCPDFVRILTVSLAPEVAPVKPALCQANWTKAFSVTFFYHLNFFTQYIQLYAPPKVVLYVWTWYKTEQNLLKNQGDLQWLRIDQENLAFTSLLSPNISSLMVSLFRITVVTYI